MLFKVLYTHQKTKKNKTWQDGYLELPVHGRKASLLSEDKRLLDNVYPGRHQVTADAEFESDKYLIQVEEEIRSNVEPSKDVYRPLQTVSSNIQRRESKPHGLAASMAIRKGFRPPSRRTNIISNANEEACRDLTTLNPVHASLGHEEQSHSTDNVTKHLFQNSRGRFGSLYNHSYLQSIDKSLHSDRSEHGNIDTSSMQEALFCTTDDRLQNFPPNRDENNHYWERRERNGHGPINVAYHDSLRKRNSFTKEDEVSCSAFSGQEAKNRGYVTKTNNSGSSEDCKRSAGQILALFSKKQRCQDVSPQRHKHFSSGSDMSLFSNDILQHNKPLQNTHENEKFASVTCVNSSSYPSERQTKFDRVDRTNFQHYYETKESLTPLGYAPVSTDSLRSQNLQINISDLDESSYIPEERFREEVVIGSESSDLQISSDRNFLHPDNDVKRRTITSEDFIQSIKRQRYNPLEEKVSAHPGSILPYSGLIDEVSDTNETLTAAMDNSVLLDIDYSPVFNPGIERTVQIAPSIQTKLIRGAVTSSIVRRTKPDERPVYYGIKEDQRSFGDYGDELHQETALSAWNADPCTTDVEANARGPTIDQNFPMSTIGATATIKRGIKCGPMDANLSTNTDTTTFKKTSPFAFVPTPSIDLQDDELTMYSDGELYTKNHTVDHSIKTTTTKPIMRHADLTGSTHMDRPQPCSSRSEIKVLQPFMPTYAKFASPAMSLDHGMRSMCGELYFPSAADCETQPTPTRVTKIPIEFNSLIEYKSVFRAALREHLNILLFDLAKSYHNALKRAEIALDFEKKSGSANKSGNVPSCPHGDCTLRTVRKDGPNKGKLFYCCPGSGSKQCKFFIWAEEFQKKSASGKNCDVIKQSRIVLSDAKSVNNFFNGQGLAFYCACTFLKKSKNGFDGGKFKKWGKGKNNRFMEECDTGKKSLYLTLPFKASSSTYSKDDLWIVSKNFNFDPGSSFIAKSTFYGPSSSGDVQITAVRNFENRTQIARPKGSFWKSTATDIMSPDLSVFVWFQHDNNETDGTTLTLRFVARVEKPIQETVHALLACNAGTELSCIDNLERISSMSDVPILSTLIYQNGSSGNIRSASSNRFVCPTNSRANQGSEWDNDEIEQKMEDVFSKYHLNEDQSSALKEITNMFTNIGNDQTEQFHTTLIHGVFGAGKSFLLAVVIMFMVDLFKMRRTENSNSNRSSSWKILVSSTTNVAVDRVLQGLLDLGFDDFVRVGSVKKIAKPVLPYSVHATGSDDQELKELQTMLKSDLSTEERAYVRKSIERHRLGMNRKKLQEVPVVGVTCAASVFQWMEKLSFKVHLLDECSQMTEPLSMLPIARFKCEKLILVGDPKQLSPTIQGSEAEHEDGLERTLFDRLKKKGHKPIMLRTQYRCHPMISAIPNELFYKGKLCDGVTAEDRLPVLDWLKPVCFFNVSKGKEICGNDGSYSNLEEADFVVFLINAMLTFGVESNNIGVITQYKSQVQKISHLLQEESSKLVTAELKSIQISTVDAFQGAEKEIIILSCVRTDHVGFIDCDRRTNVALSRAKRHLLIVGNMKILVQNPLWTKIIECCSRNLDGLTSSKVFTEAIQPKIKEILQLEELENKSKGGKKSSKKFKKNPIKYSCNSSVKNAESGRDLIQVNSEATPSCQSHPSSANDSSSSKEPGTSIIVSNNDSAICMDDDPNVEIDVSFDLQ